MAELTPEEQRKQSETYLKGLEADLALSLEGVKISAQAFDRQIIYIAGGTLGLTIGFLKDILPLAPAGSLYWLLGAWLSFGLSLLFNLIAHQASTRGYNERMALSMHYRVAHEALEPVNKEDFEATATEHIRKTNSATKWVNRLNTWQTLTIGAGIFFIIIFAYRLFSHLPPVATTKPPVAQSLQQQKDTLKHTVSDSLLTITPKDKK